MYKWYKELIGASPLALAKSICYQVVLIVCQDIDLFLIALLVVIFSRLWTSHEGVLKMPRVSIEYGVLDLIANENHSDTSPSLLAFIQILGSSHCKFWHLAKFRIGWSDGWFSKVFAQSPLLPCVLHNGRLIGLNSFSNKEISIKTFYDVAIFIAGRVGQSPILMEYGQPLFFWLSRDWPSVRTRLQIVRVG